jgi:hypothetical protein
MIGYNSFKEWVAKPTRDRYLNVLIESKGCNGMQWMKQQTRF